MYSSYLPKKHPHASQQTDATKQFHVVRVNLNKQEIKLAENPSKAREYNNVWKELLKLEMNTRS